MATKSIITQSNIIITSRIRLARNVKGYPFYINDETKSNEIIRKINRALNSENFDLFYVKNLDRIQDGALLEKNLISSYLAKNVKNGAVFVSNDQTMSIMVNEEDVIREQCLLYGFKLEQAYNKLNNIDDILHDALNFEYDERLGYLTACPTNLGTGMRASVMMFLPALTESRTLKKEIRLLEKQGLTVRGAHGEGSYPEGYLYQISNEVTLGLSENDIIEQVTNAVLVLCEQEANKRKEFYQDKIYQTKDRCLRAVGILTNCAMLSYNEFLKLFADVKLGITLNYVKIKDLQAFDKLIFKLRPMTLCEMMGDMLSPEARDIVRAEEITKELKRLLG